MHDVHASSQVLDVFACSRPTSFGGTCQPTSDCRVLPRVRSCLLNTGAAVQPDVLNLKRGAKELNDRRVLRALNEQFIEAFRQGSWELLAPILTPSFSYLDGTTGEVWTLSRYIESLRSHPVANLTLDQVMIHVDGETAVVAGRTSRPAGGCRRYLDTYTHTPDGWRCVHACVWPLPA